MFKTTTKKDEKLIIKEFNRIKKMGFVEGIGNGSGMVGRTFESLLGVEENNKIAPDFKGFEIKTKQSSSSTLVSLFTKSPSPRGSNTHLRKTYGYGGNNPYLFCMMYANKNSVSPSTYNFKLKVSNKDSKIYLRVENGSGRKINSDKIFWDFSELEKNFMEKMNSLLFVTAKSKTINGEKHFHYTNATIYYNPSIKKLIKLIKEGIVSVESRIQYNHDHGSAFKISKKNIPLLYSKVVEIY